MKINLSLRRLFVSRTRHKLIQLFFYHPNGIYYVRQLSRLIGEEINSVRRELGNLRHSSIISSESRSNKLYYWANHQSPIFRDLVIFANKSVGLGSVLLERHNRSNDVKILLYNSLFALDQSDSNSVDLIIIGDITPRDTDSLIKDEEQRRQREINYMLMSMSEYRLRRQRRDPFIVDFFLSHPMLIVGTSKDLTPNS